MYEASATRYESMKYNRCGRSGILLPGISLGFWQNFGISDDFEKMQQITFRAFDRGITHFDLANNYGPPAGEAELNFGKILGKGLGSYRDEIIISSKAGYSMWPGPYGEWGSRKYMMASIDQSLKRLGLEYLDIFYSHRPDPKTPFEETMGVLHDIVKSGKALYAGISSYDAEQTKDAIRILKNLGTPCLVHQPRYSMFDRWVEKGLLDVLGKESVGCIVFSPLAQGLLTDKYLDAVPATSRVARGLGNGAISENDISPNAIVKARQLNKIAQQRGQTLAQMALAWLLKDRRITSVLVGVSTVQQLDNNIDCLLKTDFDKEELLAIEKVLLGD